MCTYIFIIINWNWSVPKVKLRLRGCNIVSHYILYPFTFAGILEMMMKKPANAKWIWNLYPWPTESASCARVRSPGKRPRAGWCTDAAHSNLPVIGYRSSGVVRCIVACLVLPETFSRLRTSASCAIEISCRSVFAFAFKTCTAFVARADRLPAINVSIIPWCFNFCVRFRVEFSY